MNVLRRVGLGRTTALAVALLLTGWLLVSGPPGRPRPVQAPAESAFGPPSLLQVWPKARILDMPGAMPDGAPYSPWLYADPATSIGVAPTPNHTAQRVVVRTPNGIRELHRVGQDRFPNFVGFTSSGDDVFWAESTSGPSESRLWRASLRSDAPPVALTADTGDVVFFNSQYDLLVHGDRLYWVAAPSDTLVTEVRSVPVTGGPVTSTRVDGAYELSAWPWLQSAGGTGQTGSHELRSLDASLHITIPQSRAEIIGCSPIWCRSIVTVPLDGTTRYDVMKPDGSNRRRVGGADVTAAVADVALLDRFEPVLQAIGTTATAPARRLALYDVTTDRLITVADNVGQVFARQHMLWWSTGDQQHKTWRSLDLSSLTG